MTNTVKWFTSNMQGAPVISNVQGDLVSALDALLVDGFNLKTLDSLTSTGGIATATVSSGHGFVKDQVILVDGAAQAAYNGEQRLLSTTTTTFTFAVTGSPASPATGTLTSKVAPLGFQVAFSGTNKRVYRSPNVQSSRTFLRVDDSLDPAWTSTYAKYAKVTMAEAMSNVDTFEPGGRAPFDPALPTKNETGSGSGLSAVNGWYKWIYARTPSSSLGSGDGGPGARNWFLVGDDRSFYFGTTESAGNQSRRVYFFGDFNSFKTSDAYRALLTATDDFNQAQSSSSIQTENNTFFEHVGSSAGKVLMKDYTQFGANISASFATVNPDNSTFISGRTPMVPFPNGPDFSILLFPVLLREVVQKHIRGEMPGLYFIPQDRPYSDGVIVDNIPGYAGKKVILLSGAANGEQSLNSTRFGLDITGPWR
jgi:hypothetical protein